MHIACVGGSKKAIKESRCNVSETDTITQPQTKQDVTNKEAEDLAGWLHASLSFFLNRYEGVEISNKRNIYPLCKVSWDTIMHDPKFAWAKEWLVRTAESVVQYDDNRKGRDHVTTDRD